MPRLVARQVRFAPMGALALAPRMYGASFDLEVPEDPAVRDGVAVVSIRGPLMHHDSYWYDSYDAIRARVASALANRPTGLVLQIDSPGGLCSGCIETSRELRTMIEGAGIPCVAFVDGWATSGAYALACAADKIVVPPSGTVGSIGVLDTLHDVVEANKRFGVNVRLVTSGARKADGNPNAPITDDAIAAAQGDVDALAGVFFELVAERRPLTLEAVRDLQAGIAIGAEAVSLGLADEIGSFDRVVSSLSSADKPRAAGPYRTASRASRRSAARGAEVASMDLDKLRTWLGLPADADEAAIMAELEKRLAPSEEEEEPPAAESAEPPAARHSATERLLLSRIDDLERRLAARDERDTEAMVERDIASGKVATAERAEYLDLARKDPALYARLTARSRAVPTGRIVQDNEARANALGKPGRLDVSSLNEADALLVSSMRAAGVSEGRIKSALARRGAEV